MKEKMQDWWERNKGTVALYAACAGVGVVAGMYGAIGYDQGYKLGYQKGQGDTLKEVFKGMSSFRITNPNAKQDG